MKTEWVRRDVNNLRTERLLIDYLRKPNVPQDASKRLLFCARLCFAAAVILLPVRSGITLAGRPVPSIPSGYTDFILSAADIATLSMLALWAASFAMSPRRLRLGPRITWIPMAALAIAGGASALVSYDPLLSVYHAIRFMVLFWFYLFVVNEIHSAGWVLVPAGIQIAGQAVIGLAQFVAQRSVGLGAIGENYLNPRDSGVSIVAANGSRLLRAYGLTDHPNMLGGCLVFGMLLLLAAYLHGSMRLEALTVLVPAGAALVASFSRSAWLALIIGSALLISVEIFSKRRGFIRPLLLLGSAWLLVAGPFVLAYPQYFGVRLNAGNSFSTPSVEQQSIGERMILIKSYVSIFFRHPLLGVGLGAAPFALKAEEPGFTLAPEPPHVAALDAAVETGLPGGVLYLILVVSPFISYFTGRRKLLADPAATGSIALLLAIALVSLFDHYAWTLGPGRLWQWLGWGIWAATSTRAPTVQEEGPESAEVIGAHQLLHAENHRFEAHGSDADTTEFR